MIIDAHAHYYDEPDYLEKLIEEYQRLGIDKVCLSGLGPLFNQKGNDDVRLAFNKYPDRVIGFGYLRLGVDDKGKVKEFKERGFSGLKCTCPKHNYDDERFFEIYEQAEEYRMPILFHTGIITIKRKGRFRDISSKRMKPICLERIALAFPSLNIIGAHLGIPWFSEAATLTRIVSNIYFDITGAPTGWRLQKDISFFKELLYWENAFSKIVFGTDVHIKDVEDALLRDKKLFEDLGVGKEDKEKIFGGTIKKLLNL